MYVKFGTCLIMVGASGADPTPISHFLNTFSEAQICGAAKVSPYVSQI
jgi:hypothetical protein